MSKIPLRNENGQFVKGCIMPKSIVQKMKENHTRYWSGKKRDKSHGIYLEGHEVTEHTREMSRQYNKTRIGNKNPSWIDGRTKDKKHLRKLKRISNWKRRKRINKTGKVTVKELQDLYENNIKKYGTLTCGYCREPIPFGKDSIDHKIPLSRGGSDNIENLAISCLGCNMRKHTKTVEEFLNV